MNRPLLASATLVALVAASLLATACSTPPPSLPGEVAESRPGSGYLVGYLTREQQPDSLKLVSAPPGPGSAAFAADEAIYREMTALRSTPRGALATLDAELNFPAAAGAFSCALGVPITQEQTPHLTMLLRRSLSDAGGATYGAKEKYQRTRPFVNFKEATCTPALEPRLAKDGSYPSGHSSVGWAWGLILAELAPERGDALVARGLSFGQSRLVCGVHWYSDVVAGRTVAAATVARLHAEPVFVAQFALAKEEVAKARAQGLKPQRDCAAEASALALATPR
jgi:acid phosphatase (class A)